MNNHKFTFSYDAPTEDERREIEDIRKQYSPAPAAQEKEDKLETLRRLDEKVKRPPLILAISLGVVGVLVFGLGLTMVLEWQLLAGGIAVMVAGAVLMALAHPLRLAWLKHNKKKYGERIVQLSEELLNDRKN